MRYLKIIFYAFLAALVLTIIIQNTGALTTKVLFKFDLNLFSVHYATAEISMVSIAIPHYHKRSKANEKSLRGQNTP